MTPPAERALDPRTRLLLEGPIVGTLLRLGAPNVLVMFAQAGVGLIETYFIGHLGTDALAGVALVFPVVMLMQMMSAGAMGGGIASAIARALGARQREVADALVLHAVVVALAFGAVFTVAVIFGGPWLYHQMGGRSAALDAALTYSNVVFAGAVLIWLFNSLAAVIRGTGNMAVPATVTIVGTVVLVPLSPALIFGFGVIPRLGIAGGAVALLLYYAVGTLALALYLGSKRSLLKLKLAGTRLRWPLFRSILGVGAAAAISTVATNLSIGITTALVGGFGSAAIAGYGTGSRLEYLLVPLVFGLGGPLVAMVGTCIGAGQAHRALRSSWIGAGVAGLLTEVIGLCAAAWPDAWLRLFASDPAMLDAGTRYLHVVGPFYGFFRLRPGALLRLAGRGQIAVAGDGQPGAADRDRARRLAGAALGRRPERALHDAGALAGAVRPGQCRRGGGGAWFGRIGWPRTPAGLMQRALPRPSVSAAPP